jgi:L-ascorbate metabolism protein UlaG (beta-lactamase superfamily)
MLRSAAQATGTGVVAAGTLRLAAAGAEPAVAITFLGHASFLIESPAGVRIVTDYSDAIRAPVTPEIVTMNNAHPTHYSDAIEPDVKYVLRGWDPAGGVPSHRLEYGDVRIHNTAAPATTAARPLCSTSPIRASRISGICTTR